MALEEPGGGALFRGTAEPAGQPSKGQLIHPSTHTSPPPPTKAPSPAHGVVVIGVTEAGGFQLAAHHGAGALVARQVALESTLAVDAGACGGRRAAQKGARVGSGPGLSSAGSKAPRPLRALITSAGLSLTVLLRGLSVPRSLAPEGNYGLRFGLFVQGLHTARGVRTTNEEKKRQKTQSNEGKAERNKSGAAAGVEYGREYDYKREHGR